jgi:hypothetical protein
MRTARRAAVVLAASLTFAGAIALVPPVFGARDSLPGLTGFLVAAAQPIWVASIGGVGVLLALRRPENRVSWLFVALGPLVAFVSGAWAYVWEAPAGWEALYMWLSVVLSYFTVALAGPGLALLFPDGRLPSPRWRAPVLAFALTFVVGVLLLSVTPGELSEMSPEASTADRAVPFEVALLEPVAPLVTIALWGSFLILAALAVAAVVRRRRHGTPMVRAQLRWFGVAAALVPLGIGISIVHSLVDPGAETVVGVLVLFAGFVLVPVSVAIAVLRYRLYEIDRVVSRTIGWAAVSAVLGAVFVAVVLTLQAVLVGPAQGEALAIAISTLVTFAVFQPVRRRVQAAVDRRFHRSRYDAQRLLDVLALRLRDGMDREEIVAELRGVADATLQPTAASVWLRDG